MFRNIHLGHTRVCPRWGLVALINCPTRVGQFIKGRTIFFAHLQFGPEPHPVMYRDARTDENSNFPLGENGRGLHTNLMRLRRVRPAQYGGWRSLGTGCTKVFQHLRVQGRQRRSRYRSVPLEFGQVLLDLARHDIRASG
eukprot:COSAG02_NODE_400_length_23094_cov_309.555990_7_plen_140_part_00